MKERRKNMRKFFDTIISGCYIMIFILFIPIMFIEAVVKGFMYGRKNGKIKDDAAMEELKDTLYFYRLFIKD
jgi:hypothetical protein